MGARIGPRRPLLRLIALSIGAAGIVGALLGCSAAPGAPAAQQATAPVAPPTAVVPTEIRATPGPAQPAATADQATAIPAPPTALPEAQEPLPPLVLTREGNLWYSDGSGAPLRQLTDTGPNDTIEDPAVSLDGRQVVFIQVTRPEPDDANPEFATALYVVGIDGTGLREVVGHEPGRLLIGPVWATDGAAIYAFSSTEEPIDGGGTERRYRIIRVDPATGALQPVIEDALDPAFSPDGARMAFVQFLPDSYALSLHLAAPDGSGATELIGADVFQSVYAPDFSPDGSRLAFAAVGGPVTDEQGFPVGGSETPRSPLDLALALFEPPMAEAHGTHWEIWTVNSDGSGLRSLTNIGEELPKVAFSPDGTELVFMTISGIYRMNADGSELRRIDPIGDTGGLDWVRQ